MQTNTKKPDFKMVEDLGRAQVVECLVDGLNFLRGETPEAAQKLAKRVLANIIIEHLDASGYVVTRRAPTMTEDLGMTLSESASSLSDSA